MRTIHISTRLQSASAVLMLLVCTALAHAQTTDADSSAAGDDRYARVMVGTFGAGTMNMHTGSFDTYDGILECGTFTDANTIGWMAGNTLDFSVGGPFGLSVRAYYHQADGDFESPNSVSPLVLVGEETLVPLESQYVVATTLDYVMLDLLAKLRIGGGLYAALGPSVGYATRAAFEQTEQILSPSGATFVNGGTERQIAAGSFEEQGTGNTSRQIRLAATGAIGVDVFLTDNVVLNPEAAYTYGFTNVLSGVDWKVSDLRASIGLKWAFSPPEKIIVPNEGPVAEAPVPDPVVAFDVDGTNSDGVTLKNPEVLVTEDRAMEVMPLLPFVFFDSSSAALPARYDRISPSARSAFSEDRLDGEVLDVYHDVLNIVGHRMQEFPQATLSLSGYREPIDDGSDASIAAGRAAAVRDYLVNAWGVDPKRISVRSGGLPPRASNRDIADGRQENRRVEIRASDDRILAPVRRTHLDRSIEPRTLALEPHVQYPEHVTGWSGSIGGPTGQLWSSDGDGRPNRSVPWTVDASKLDQVLGGDQSATMSAEFAVKTDGGRTLSSTRSIPVRRVITSHRLNGEVVRDTLIERYALIFFDFDSPDIIDVNRPVLDVVRSRMRTSSTVHVTGLTDRIGPDDHNRELSAERAQAVAKAVRTRIIPESIDTEGAGEKLIYDNDLPEGRFYNRTVIVEIATPVE